MISVMALVMATQAALVYQVQYKTEVAYAAGIAGAVVLVRRRFYCWLPGYRLGLPIRNLAVEVEAEGLEYFDGDELDLQYFDCADYAAGD